MASRLDGLAAADIRQLARQLFTSDGSGLDPTTMTAPDLAVYIEGHYSGATIADALRVLRSRGVIGNSHAEANAAALGNDRDCPLEAPTGLKHPSGANVYGPCRLKEGHDGPCLPKATSLQAALERARKQRGPIPTWDRTNQIQDDSLENLREYVTQDQLLGFGETLASRVAEQASEMRKLLSQDLARLAADLPTRPVFVQVTLPEAAKPKVLQRRPHAAFEKALRLARAGLNVMFIGPAGSGKTTLAADVAECLDRPFAFQSLTAGTPEGALVGRLMPLGAGGAMRYVASPFVCAFAGERNTLGADGLTTVVADESQEGVILLDEVDAADANTLLVLNAALANNAMTIETRAAFGLPVIVRRGENCVILSAANTFGTGMDLQFAGRNALDAAFLDRWYPVYVNYDPVLEAKIASLPEPNIPRWQAVPPPNEPEWRALARWILETREKIVAAGLKKTWGTRALIKARAARWAGVPSAEIKQDLTLGWPADHVRKVLGP